MTRPSAALEALTLEFARRDEDDEPPPACAGDDRFTSESPEDRLTVVGLCGPCPLFYLCAAASRRMTWGVWAGADKSTPSVTKTVAVTTTRGRAA